MGTPNGGGHRMHEYEKSRFSANLSDCLGNDTTESHSFYGMQTGNRT